MSEIKSINDMERDIQFISNIISQIADYAQFNDMDVNDTLETIANDILTICKIADFNGLKKGDNEHGN